MTTMTVAPALAPTAPCPPWCVPTGCERQTEFEPNGRRTEVVIHNGPATHVDGVDSPGSILVAANRIDVDTACGPAYVEIQAGGTFLYLPPDRARQFAAAVLDAASVVEAGAR